MLRRELTTEIEINASAEKVWKILTDFSAYPVWNPMIRQAKGEIVRGARLQIHFQPEGKRASHFKPTLITVEPCRELRWLGWPRIPLLIDSEHYWILTPKQNDKTHLVHGIVFFGLFAFCFSGNVKKSTARAFQDMNQAHKQRAEQKAQEA